MQNILGLTGTCLIDFGRTRSGPSDSDPTSQSGSGGGRRLLALAARLGGGELTGVDRNHDSGHDFDSGWAWERAGAMANTTRASGQDAKNWRGAFNG